MAKPWRDMTKRERALYSNAAAEFYAAGYGKQPRLVDVPPERKRSATPRTDPTEHQLQANVIHWWKLAHNSYMLPEFALFAIPNGANKSMAQRMKFKREGLRPGIPDLMLAAVRELPVLGHPMIHHGLFIEMKRKGGKESDSQKEVGEYLWSRLYEYRVCDSDVQAIEAIKAYLA